MIFLPSVGHKGNQIWRRLQSIHRASQDRPEVLLPGCGASFVFAKAKFLWQCDLALVWGHQTRMAAVGSKQSKAGLSLSSFQNALKLGYEYICDKVIRPKLSKLFHKMPQSKLMQELLSMWSLFKGIVRSKKHDLARKINKPAFFILTLPS